MSLESIANKNPNCGGADANTGKNGCQVEWSSPLHVIGLKRGFVIPKETNFNIDYINEQIQKGNFIPLIGAETYENQSSEDQFQTNSRGVERLNLLGLPKFEFVFEEGHEFYRQLSRLTSYKSLDFIFADETGSWKMAVTSKGDFKGFSAGQALAKMTKTREIGGESEGKPFSIQLLDRVQWDRDYAIIQRSELDFSPDEVDGVNGVHIAFDPIPSAGTTLEVDVTLAADHYTPVEGLTKDDFLVSVKGTAKEPTSITEPAPGHYKLTVPSMTTGDEVFVKLYDSTLLVNIVQNNDILYRGSTRTDKVVA